MVFHCIYVPHLYPFICRWTFRLFPRLHCCEGCCSEHRGACVFLNYSFVHVEKGTLLHCWWESKLVQPLWKTVQRFLRKLKIGLPYDPAIPLLDIYPSLLNLRRSLSFPSRLCFSQSSPLLTFPVLEKDQESKLCSHHLHIDFSSSSLRPFLLFVMFVVVGFGFFIYLSCQLLRYRGWDSISLVLCLQVFLS